VTAFTEPEVEDAFAAFPDEHRELLFTLRAMIFDVARETPEAGALRETLKWGQPSYLTTPRTGTTLRLGVRGMDAAIFVHCQTTLVESFRALHGDALRYEGNRAVLLDPRQPLPATILRRCIRAALTYHRRPRSQRVQK